MQFSIISLVAFASYAFADGGFLSTCSNLRLNGYTLTANCHNSHGGTGDSSINLNPCINNNNGRMYCGGYVRILVIKTTADLRPQWWISKLLQWLLVG
jgi:hypothetical protein